MGIHLSVAHNLKPLAKKMASDLRYTDHHDVFTSQWIVTQTEGMNSWLRQYLAKENEIAANIRFEKPNDIINRIYYLLGEGKKRNAIDTETLKWSLFNLLNEQEFQDRFPEIAAYYIGNAIRQIAFAGELADIFDQYQIYRFDSIEQWNQQWINGTPAEEWQSWLWIRSKEKLNESFRDKTEIAKTILDRLASEEAQKRIQQIIPSLHFFGMAVITPYYLRIFHELAKYIDIYFYLINPAPNDYWLDDQSEKQLARLRNKHFDTSLITTGNDLLHNWGRITKESFSLLFSHDDFVNNYELIETETIKQDSLLSKIQDDIHQNANTERRNKLRDADSKDGSVTINGCYTPVREVEVLYNYLVEQVDSAKKTISPRDILVLVTDIDLYAPYIKAVFNHAPYAFPFTIADETITADNNMFTALQDILNLDAHFFKAEDILNLLESPYIRKRFQILDVEAIRSAIRQAGIYFSMDGRTEDDTRYISWSFGLKKLLYGICMSGEEEYTDGIDHFIPLDTSEGALALERVKLVHFIKILEDKLQKRADVKTISGWADYLMEVMEDLIFASGERDDDDYATFVGLLEQMVELNEAAPMEVSFDVFRHSFLHKLKLENRAGSFASAGITFCSMVPMRSIPYKIVALLGMNSGKFPRKDTPLSFSLLSKERKPGDRNVKDNDKHLFIETILSAEEKLYISYIAKDAKDGATLPPSSLVDEFIDYIARGMGEDTDDFKKRWVTEHPLHGFSRKYFESPLKNYLTEDRYLTGIEVKKDLPVSTIEQHFEKLDLHEFAVFFKNPPKVYLNKQLGIYYREDEVLIPDHEKFELDNLDKAIVQNELLMADEDQIEKFISEQKRAGKIPLKNMGDAAIKTAYKEREELREYVDAEIRGIDPVSIDIEITIGDTTILGSVPSIYGTKFISICNSSNRLPKLVPEYVKYLTLIASGQNIDFIFLAKNMNPCRIVSGSITRELALERLTQLLAFFKQGHKDYFLFWAAAAKGEFENLSEEWTDFNRFYQEEAESEFSYDMKDDYLKKAVEHGFFDESRYDLFRENMLTILKPLQELLPHPFEKQ
ncbi:MAG: exodeoxyribonuclease V subunit gamma [Chitinophagaceae bacterium]